MRVTTILPVSRLTYLDRVLDSLQKQTYKAQSLIVVFDGDEDYREAEDRILQLDYEFILYVKSNNKQPAFAITERRHHISSIHNQLTHLIGDADWVFSVEDDGVLPTTALERLVNVAKSREDAGLVTGVELGRWGVPYVGAWTVDDVFHTQLVRSMESHAGEDLIEEIDGCGLYCALIRADLYKSHIFGSDNGLGPDVNLGLYIRQCGRKNYIDWAVPVTHLTNRSGVEIEIPATDRSDTVILSLLAHNIWQQAKYGQSLPKTI